MTRCYSRTPYQRSKKTILIFRLDLEIINTQKKKFYWKKPYSCIACKSKTVWGHGFVLRYFTGYTQGLWIKRWRCPNCGTVYTVRPTNYPVGFQYDMPTIYESILNRLNGGAYIKEVPYQNQQYWFKALKFQCSILSNWNDINQFFQDSVLHNEYKVTFRLKKELVLCRGDPPHLLFAVKTK